MKTLSSRERLARTLRGEPTDRIPVFPPVTWRPRALDPAEPPYEWMSRPEFQAVIPLVDAHCDDFVHATAFDDLFDRRFLEAPARYVESGPAERRDGRWTVRRHTVHTPAGDLHTTEEAEDNVRTCWHVEPLVKTVDDARRLLAVPFEFEPPDVQPFFDE